MEVRTKKLRQANFKQEYKWRQNGKNQSASNKSEQYSLDLSQVRGDDEQEYLMDDGNTKNTSGPKQNAQQLQNQIQLQYLNNQFIQAQKTQYLDAYSSYLNNDIANPIQNILQNPFLQQQLQQAGPQFNNRFSMDFQNYQNSFPQQFGADFNTNLLKSQQMMGNLINNNLLQQNIGNSPWNNGLQNTNMQNFKQVCNQASNSIIDKQKALAQKKDTNDSESFIQDNAKYKSNGAEQNIQSKGAQQGEKGPIHKGQRSQTRRAQSQKKNHNSPKSKRNQAASNKRHNAAGKGGDNKENRANNMQQNQANRS